MTSVAWALLLLFLLPASVSAGPPAISNHVSHSDAARVLTSPRGQERIQPSNVQICVSFCVPSAIPCDSAVKDTNKVVTGESPRTQRARRELKLGHYHQSNSQRTPARRPGSRTRGRPRLRRPDVIYYPTPQETAVEMLRLANLKQDDVLYDLGSGDGRIPILAAQQYGVRAVGIEIDPKMVTLAQERARQAQVSDLVSFRNADMFRIDIRGATVVTLYLSNRLNLLLRPKLLAELRPGSRILSHDFHMGDWEPEQTVKVPWQSNLYRTVYLWRVPARGLQRRTRNAVPH